MKIVQITGKEKVELKEVPDPKAKGEFAVVKILSSPMCTEYKGYRDGITSSSLGHEAAGEVVEIGRDGPVKVGDRVVVMPQRPCGRCPLCLKGEYIHCQQCLNIEKETGYEHGDGTYAQYILKQDWLLVPIPEGVSCDQASMACCGLGPTFGAMQIMNVDAFDTVVITGMGPVGLGGVINAVHRGARVIAVSRNPYRAKLAKELGAEVVVNPEDKDALKQLMDLTDGIGFESGVECAGVPERMRLLVDGVKRKGQIAFVGEAGDFTIKVSDDMIRKGIALHGAWHYNLSDIPRMMKIISDTLEKLDKLITHTYPMTKVEEAFNLQLEGKCGKILLHPWD
jgi:L-iditol 2-dehydrogenase